MPHDITGWIHTIAALIALLTGSIILAKTKGTLLHKRVGRFYGIAMMIVCVTSFMMYRLHGKIGILHFFAFVSTVTLCLGMLPLYFKGFKSPIMNHLAMMYWSVIGLYSAFVAEVLTRLPMIFEIENTYGIFYAIVGFSAGVVSMIGGFFFKKKKLIWQEQFT
ncbi:DUF2306 domain-containing protein [uncultured Kordia sp.]|uniref:DUF2306 domain-containing protein n=1 Tax=uncultured Kordia sp. TaxID=507699 RepID=UPI0026374AD9|nr:DUF2306 domain-containing protein [uncultured Kordia sp.]